MSCWSNCIGFCWIASLGRQYTILHKFYSAVFSFLQRNDMVCQQITMVYFKLFVQTIWRCTSYFENDDENLINAPKRQAGCVSLLKIHRVTSKQDKVTISAQMLSCSAFYCAEERFIWVKAACCCCRGTNNTHRRPLQVAFLQKFPDPTQSFVSFFQHSQRIEAKLKTQGSNLQDKCACVFLREACTLWWNLQLPLACS